MRQREPRWRRTRQTHSPVAGFSISISTAVAMSWLGRMYAHGSVIFAFRLRRGRTTFTERVSSKTGGPWAVSDSDQVFREQGTEAYRSFQVAVHEFWPFRGKKTGIGEL